MEGERLADPRRRAGAGCPRHPAGAAGRAAKAAPPHTGLSATFGRREGGSPASGRPAQPLPPGPAAPALRPPRRASPGPLHPNQRLDRHTDPQTDTRPWSSPLTYLQPRFLLETPSDRPPPVGGELQPHRPGIAGRGPAPRQRPGAWSGAALGSVPLGLAGLGQGSRPPAPGSPPPRLAGNTPGIRLRDGRGRVK